MPNYTEDEYRELLANQSKATKQAPREPRTCAREGCDEVFIPTKRGKYCCDRCKGLVKAAQNAAYKERGPEYHKTKTLAKAPSDYGDPFKGEVNRCPDCNAVYDSTTTCSGDKNKRQFTTKFKGIDMDGFICFCGHRHWRYK